MPTYATHPRQEPTVPTTNPPNLVVVGAPLLQILVTTFQTLSFRLSFLNFLQILAISPIYLDPNYSNTGRQIPDIRAYVPQP